MLSASLRTHDLSQAVKLHPALRAGDVLVGDRGFCSYGHLAFLSQHDVHAVFRMHQKQRVDFTSGRAHVEPMWSRANAVPRANEAARVRVACEKQGQSKLWSPSFCFRVLPTDLIVTRRFSMAARLS